MFSLDFAFQFPNPAVDRRTALHDATRAPAAAADDNVDPTVNSLALFPPLLCVFLTQDRLLKPLSGLIGYNAEWRELAEVVSRVNIEAERERARLYFTQVFILFFFIKTFFSISCLIFHHIFSRTLRHLNIFLITLCSL